MSGLSSNRSKVLDLTKANTDKTFHNMLRVRSKSQKNIYVETITTPVKSKSLSRKNSHRPNDHNLFGDVSKMRSTPAKNVAIPSYQFGCKKPVSGSKKDESFKIIGSSLSTKNADVKVIKFDKFADIVQKNTKINSISAYDYKKIKQCGLGSGNIYKCFDHDTVDPTPPRKLTPFKQKVDIQMHGPNPYKYLNPKEHKDLERQDKYKNSARSTRYANYMGSSGMKSTLSWGGKK